MNLFSRFSIRKSTSQVIHNPTQISDGWLYLSLAVVFGIIIAVFKSLG